MKNNRRKFFKTIGLAAAGAVVTGLHSKKSKASDKIKWKMVTSWPKNFPGLGAGAETLAKYINKLSGGSLTVKVFGAGELVPPLGVFDFVSSGGAEMGHSGAYYWKGKTEAAQFFSSVPFGMTAQEMNSWLYYGDGLKLWEKVYEDFDLVPRPAGNTGVQMGGWFNKEINSTEDLNGLKMRIPGLGGEVLARAGGTPFTLAGSEIFTSLQTGVIDATEWVGPYNDRAFGLHKAAQYYYYPGWHEPGPTLECIINRQAYNKLSDQHKSIIDIACKAANIDMISDYMSKNYQALEYFKQEQVKIKKFPKEVLIKLNKISNEVLVDLSQKNQLSKKVYDSYTNFLKRVRPWTLISEDGYLSSFE
jgi:TRAP-type mannitol/chloroaromatic compound transport system substrate-binding protein